MRAGGVDRRPEGPKTVLLSGLVEAKPLPRKPRVVGIAAARECGDCRACCMVFEIPEVKKPCNEMCRFAGNGAGEPGCKVYGHRPEVCREFECSWKHGLAGASDRPDRLGVMFYTVDLADGKPGLAIVETTAGAFERPRVLAMIRQYQIRKPGRVLLRRAADRSFALTSIMIEGKPLGSVAKIVGA